jgi:subtilisin family serine protease
MRRFALAVVLFLFSASSRAATTRRETLEAFSRAERVPVIVSLREPVPAAGRARISAIRTTADAVIAELPLGSAGVSVRWSHLPGFAATITGEALLHLLQDPRVAAVDVDSGGAGALKESVPLIGGDKVRAMGYTGRGVVVAILDSGIDETHPDLKDALVGESCFCRNADGTGCCPNSQTTQSGPGAAADDNGHGTNVAGIVASRGHVSSPGVAPDALIVAVKVLDKKNAFFSTTQVLSGLDWLLENHPEVRVVNMSLLTNATFPGYCDQDTSFTQLFASAINALVARGTSVFACSGNGGLTTAMGAPACVQNAISVGAVYDAPFSNGVNTSFCSVPVAVPDQITCFSNSDATLDLLAPGALITSDGIGGGLSTYAGTSQATPHCAGAAAVLLQVDPSLTPAQIEATLKSTGKPITDSRNQITTPRIDLLAAVTATPKVPRSPRRHAAAH